MIQNPTSDGDGDDDDDLDLDTEELLIEDQPTNFSLITDSIPFNHLSLDTYHHPHHQHHRHSGEDETSFSRFEIQNVDVDDFGSKPFNIDTDSFSNIDLSKYSINRFVMEQRNFTGIISGDDYRNYHYRNRHQENVGFKCPVCLKFQKKLFCHNCIRNGDFTHSTNNFLERFADKKLKFIKLKEQQFHDSLIVQKHFSNDILKDELISKIATMEKSIKTLNKIYAEKSSMINEMKSLLDRTERERLKCHKKQLTLKERIHTVKNQLAKQSVIINNCFQEKTNHENEMKMSIQNKLILLTTYIFPVTESLTISPNLNLSFFNCDDECDISENSHDSSEAMPLLSYDDDYYKSNSNAKNSDLKIVRYKIVDSWINLDEDFLAGTHSNSMEYLDIRDNSFRDDHRRIMSALSYLCHLTNLIALICEIHLPRKLLFSELSCKRMNKEEFSRKIAELNANIIFLCIINRVDLRLLNPKQSFKNMKHLLDVINIATNLDNHFEIPNGFHKMIQDELLNDINQIVPNSSGMVGAGGIAAAGLLDATDISESDFDFVESNIPDLNLENAQPPTSFLSSLVSSFYKTHK